MPLSDHHALPTLELTQSSGKVTALSVQSGLPGGATAPGQPDGRYTSVIGKDDSSLLSLLNSSTMPNQGPTPLERWWTPHVTLGVRLVSVLDDDMQHVGRAAYLRGILLRRG
jgi:hypothetical protein